MARKVYFSRKTESGSVEFVDGQTDGRGGQAHRAYSDPHEGYKAVGWQGESVVMVGPVGQVVCAYGPAAVAKLG